MTILVGNNDAFPLRNLLGVHSATGYRFKARLYHPPDMIFRKDRLIDSSNDDFEIS